MVEKKTVTTQKKKVLIDVEVVKFLNGSGRLNGFNYGERPAAEPNFWWRRYLPKVPND